MQVSAALVPVFILILIGYGMRRLNFPGDSFWPPAEKFLYYFLFPMMLVDKLTYAKRDGLLLDHLFLAILLAFAIATVLMMGLQRWRRWSGARFTSVYQGAVRFNSYVGLAAVQALQGDQGLALAALSMSMMIPLINVLCIGAFALYVEQSAPGWRGVGKAIITNPLILGSLAGLTFNSLGISFPDAVNQVLKLVGNMALPLGLLCVGAALDLRSLKGAGSSLMISSAFKLGLFPLIFVGSALALQLPPLNVTVFAVLGCLPTATASYILARQLGGDAPLMAGIISAQTLMAMLTMPLALSLLTAALQWLG
ncbi:predicted Permease [Hahella chejuensis KCTC 2396]|uniref:Predicted Permease n=2 Tax=Hahella chejuensis TaxID=158327 RepID=Q2S7U7_HAHCH|nr:predicted Permease [Hahella chejuensis KCTC 2396]